MNAWDFDTVWTTNATTPPTFRTTEAGDTDGISSMVENAAPNSGDGNNDGTPDSAQSNVASFVNVITGKYITVAVPANCSLSNSSVTAESANAAQDASYSYPLGMANFTADCGTNGYTAAVKIYFHGAGSASYIARKFIGGAYSTISGATIAAVTIGGQSARELSYDVTDGDAATDSDGAANGVIVDPAGLAVAEDTTTNTGGGTSTSSNDGTLASTGDSTLAIFVVGGILVAAAGMLLVARRRQTAQG